MYTSEVTIIEQVSGAVALLKLWFLTTKLICFNFYIYIHCNTTLHTLSSDSIAIHVHSQIHVHLYIYSLASACSGMSKLSKYMCIKRQKVCFQSNLEVHGKLWSGGKLHAVYMYMCMCMHLLNADRCEGVVGQFPRMWLSFPFFLFLCHL